MIPLGILATAGANGGATGSYELISSTILTTNTSSVTFSSIVGTYKHLQIRSTARTDRALQIDGVRLRLNSDSGSNYAGHRLLGSGSAVTSNANLSQTAIVDQLAAGNTASSGIFGSNIMDILDYASTTKYKTTRAMAGANTVAYNYLSFISGLWMNTSSISSITLSPESGTNFIAGSRFSLYGIKG